jgi:periodic tryptophan protein 1
LNFSRLPSGFGTISFAMSMITATAWVPRGFAAPFPTKYTFDEDEFQRIADLAKLQLDDANEELEDARKAEETGADPDAMVEDDGSDDENASKAVKSKTLVCAGVS